MISQPAPPPVSPAHPAQRHSGEQCQTAAGAGPTTGGVTNGLQQLWTVNGQRMARQQVPLLRGNADGRGNRRAGPGVRGGADVVEVVVSPVPQVRQGCGKREFSAAPAYGVTICGAV